MTALLCACVISLLDNFRFTVNCIRLALDSLQQIKKPEATNACEDTRTPFKKRITSQLQPASLKIVLLPSGNLWVTRVSESLTVVARTRKRNFRARLPRGATVSMWLGAVLSGTQRPQAQSNYWMLVLILPCKEKREYICINSFSP